MSFFDTVIVQPIFNLLMLIYSLIPDFGVSIIIFTIWCACCYGRW